MSCINRLQRNNTYAHECLSEETSEVEVVVGVEVEGIVVVVEEEQDGAAMLREKSQRKRTYST